MPSLANEHFIWKDGTLAENWIEPFWVEFKQTPTYYCY